MKITEYVNNLLKINSDNDVSLPEHQQNTNVGSCPVCGNHKISFSRERFGTVSKSFSQKNLIGIGRTRQSSSQSAFRTVGLCQTCGYTWECNTDVEKTTSRKNLWLWVLGWLFIFPIPLSILIIRKKHIKPVIKLGIIVIAWIVFFALAEINSNVDSSEANISSIENVQQNNYADDEVVNGFIVEFNNSTPYEIINISRGSTFYNYFGYANDRRLEMINLSDAFCLTIHGGQNPEDKESMYDVFRWAIRVLDTSITEDTVNEILTEFDERDVLIEDYIINDNITITYMPIKELSYGNSSGRIDIKAHNYK